MAKLCSLLNNICHSIFKQALIKCTYVYVLRAMGSNPNNLSSSLNEPLLFKRG